jgi:SulP family sulfate permease
VTEEDGQSKEEGKSPGDDQPKGSPLGDVQKQFTSVAEETKLLGKKVTTKTSNIIETVKVTTAQVKQDASVNSRKKKNHVKDYLPILEWGPKYDRKFLQKDAIIGITVACLIIPDTLACATIAGVPPQHGLVAGLFAALLYAIVGSAKHVVGEVPSALSAMAAATAVSLAVVGTDDYNQIIFMISFMAGIACLAAGVLRLGFISNFISKPILKGFLFGIGLTIVASNLPKVLGIPKGEGNFFQQIIYLVQNLGETNFYALGLALAAFAIIVIVEKKNKRLPGLLFALVFGILATWIMVSYFGINISYIGYIPSGIPLPSIPQVPSSTMDALIPAAIGVGFIGYMQTLAIGKSVGERKGYDVDKDQEFLAVGSTNFVGGLFTGIPSGGSTSVSAVNENAGAESQVSTLVAAGIVLLTLLFLTPLFYYLPSCVLGIIILLAVRSVLDVKEQARFYRINPSDFFLSVLAIFGVLLLNILAGLMVAVIISIILLMLRSSTPDISTEGRLEGRRGWFSVERNPEAQQVEGLMILRPEGSLYFVNSDSVFDEIRYKVSTMQGTKVVLLDLNMSSSIDVTACDGLKKYINESNKKGIKVWLVSVHGPVKKVLDNAGISKMVGDDFYLEINDAVDHYNNEYGIPQDDQVSDRSSQEPT